MTMTSERIIRDVVGRMADEAPEPLEFDELGVPLVAGPDSQRSRLRTRRIAAFAGVLAAAVVFTVTALLVTGNAPNDATPVGTPTEATVGEFNEALTGALGVLEEAPGIQGVEESYIQTHLAGRVWFSTRQSGDAVVVEQTDVDVRESAWWLTSASPSAVGENIITTARTVINGDYYQSTTSNRDSEPWSQLETEPPGTLAFGLAFFDDQFGPRLREQLTPPDAHVTRQATANGGEIWTLSTVSGETSGEQRFYIHPDGYLASWSWQALGIEADPTDQTIPIDAGNVAYQPLDNPAQLTTPEIGTPLDLTAYDLPAGFQISK